MSKRYLGIEVTGGVVTVVDADVPDDASAQITVLSDSTWKLQAGDRGPALSVLYQRCAGYVREHKIDLVLVKASAVPPRVSASLALLESAEVRGVVIAASASIGPVQNVSKAVVSRTYGERKFDEYLADDSFWNAHVTGEKLRKSSRDAAMLILAARTR